MPHKGYKHTPETRKKMSIARKGKYQGSKHPMWGKHHTPESIAKNAAAHIGKHLTPEHRSKISAAGKGRKATPETRIKMSIVKRGNKHPMWRGGISREPYAWTFDNELKEAVRKRDGYRCQLCGVPQEGCRTRLSVHHIDYDKRNSDPVNLTALCRPCNSRVNKNRKHWTAFFQEIMIQRAIGSFAG